jgi:type IV secretion system protein TrbJ
MQAVGTIAEQQVEQLMKLRELMIADMSSKQAYQAAIIQQQAASQAAAQRFFTYTPAFSDGRKFGPGWN